MMRVALGQLPEATDASLAFVRQLGLRGIQFNTPNLPGERRWEYEDLVALRQRCEAAGLVLTRGRLGTVVTSDAVDGLGADAAVRLAAGDYARAARAAGIPDEDAVALVREALTRLP